MKTSRRNYGRLIKWGEDSKCGFYPHCHLHSDKGDVPVSWCAHNKKTRGPKILEAVAENAKTLHGISGERILVELKKILSGDHGDLIYLIYNLNMALMYVYLLMKVWKNFAKSVKNAKSFLPKPRTLLTAI